MKRYLPFIIIAAVAALTVGAGAMLYRAKQRAIPTASTTSTRVDKTISETADTFEGKAAHVRGAPDAPVTLEVFGDFQCPSCAMISGVISKLEQEYGPRLRVVFRHFPLAMHPHAMDAAQAAEAAGLQGRFWEMHDMLYQYQSVWSKASDPGRLFETYAASLGLDVERFREDSKSNEVRTRIVVEGEDGDSRGVKNTPTLFVNGQEARAAFTAERLREAIDAALIGHKSS
jgi:NhaA family Na+:H+ antiporter